jgi:hypothetical protein
MSRSDTVAMWFFIVIGLGLVGVTTWGGVTRIAEGFSTGAVEVPAVFVGTEAQAPIGPGGAMRPVELSSAVLATDGLSVAGRGALVLEQLVLIASVATVIGCLIAVTISVMRGRVFNRRNTALVTIGGAAALAGLLGVPFFGNMVANDAFRAISDGTFDNVILSVQVPPLILVAFISAMASTVFTIGDRLQRETELLV